MKNNITKQKGPHKSTSLEKKFLANCQNSQSTSRFERTMRETKKKHALFPAKVPRSSVSKTGAEGRSARPRRGETSSRHSRGQDRSTRRKQRQYGLPQRVRAKSQWCLGSFEPLARLAKRREGLGGQHLAGFAIPSCAAGRGLRA